MTKAPRYLARTPLFAHLLALTLGIVMGRTAMEPLAYAGEATGETTAEAAIENADESDATTAKVAVPTAPAPASDPDATPKTEPTPGPTPGSTPKRPTPPTKVLLEREAMLTAAAKVTRESHPNADSVIVGRAHHVTYKPDGTYVQWNEGYVKILTDKARADHAVLSSWFTIPYQYAEDCTIPVIEIIKPDGAVKAIDAEKAGKVVNNNSSMGSNIISPNDKVRRVPLPGLEVGDVLHYNMFDRVVQPRMRDSFNDHFGFEGGSPILYAEATVVAPAERPLRSIAVKGRVGDTLTAIPPESEKGAITYRWIAKDVPQYYPEPKMPPAYMVAQRVLVSTSPDWPSVSRWYWNLSEPHFKDTPAMREMVAKLVEGKKTREEKIAAIFRWVSQEVRYLGITMESEAPGYEPHDVDITFEKRHGVCRDKAALLAVMLRIGGFEAFPVLIHNGYRKDAEVPQPYFNHAITGVREPDGSIRLMDATDENTKRILPAYLNDKSYLVASPEGDPLRVSPIIPAEENLVRIETAGRIDDQGNLVAESTLHFDGINDNIYRGYFARRKPAERKRYFEGVIKDVAAGARLVDYALEPADMNDTAKPLVAHLRFQAENVLIRDDEGGDAVAMLPVPRLGTRVGMVNWILGETGLEERRFPLVTNVACGVLESLKLELPESLGKVVSMPVYKPVDNETLAWKQSLAPVGDTLLGESEFQLKVTEFSPKQYAGLKKTLERIEYNQRRMPILAVTPRPKAIESRLVDEGVDALVLERTLEYDLSGPQAWTVTDQVRKRILTYAGKKRYSEIKIYYNPEWETVRVDRAAVTLPSGQVVTISDKEINELDQGWAGKAPRYPVGKILVVSLPSVEEGAVLDYQITRVVKDRPFFALRQSLAGFEPILRKTIRVRAPKGVTLHHELLRPDNDALREARIQASDGEHPEGGHEYTWTAENVRPVKRERRLPPLYAMAPTVFASTTDDWTVLAEGIEKALAPALRDQAEAAAKGKALAATAPSREAGVRAIRDFVATAIANAGPALDELPWSHFSPADQTLADGYGNGADRAILLHAMLHGAGYKPRIVLASQSPRVESLIQPLLASPDWRLFTTMLVAVPLGSKTIHLGDTDQYAPLGGARHAWRLGMDLEARSLGPIAVEPSFEDRTQYDFVIRLRDNGDATIRQTRWYGGMDYARMNKLFAEMPPEKAKRYFQEAVAKVSQGASLVGKPLVDFENYPGRVEFEVQVERYAVLDERFLYLGLPRTLDGLFWLRSDTRENPLDFDERRQHRITTLVALPDTFRVPRIVPPKLTWDAPANAGRVAVRRGLFTPDGPGSGDLALADTRGKDLVGLLRDGHHVLSIVQSAELNPALFPAGDYPALLEVESRLGHRAARTILLSAREPSVALRLTVAASGMRFGDRPLARDALGKALAEARLKQPGARLEVTADGAVPAERMETILKVAREAGFTKIKVQPPTP